MIRGKYDMALSKTAPLKRYASFFQAGISYAEFTLPDEKKVSREIEKWKAKFTRKLAPRFRELVYRRSEVGPMVNSEEAIMGEPEPCRRLKPMGRDEIVVGINISRSYSSDALVHMRGGAILALISIANKRGQKVRVEACYGNGVTIDRGAGKCHVRIGLPGCSTPNLTRLCCSPGVLKITGSRLVDPLAHTVGSNWQGVYRFYEWEKVPGFPKEYDFVLDRIDTCDPVKEEKRIMDQLQALLLVQK